MKTPEALLFLQGIFMRRVEQYVAPRRLPQRNAFYFYYTNIYLIDRSLQENKQTI